MVVQNTKWAVFVLPHKDSWLVCLPTESQNTFFFVGATDSSSMVHSSTLCDSFLGLFLSWTNNPASKVKNNTKMYYLFWWKNNNSGTNHTARSCTKHNVQIYQIQEVDLFRLLSVCHGRVVLWLETLRVLQEKAHPEMDSLPGLTDPLWALQETRLRYLFPVWCWDHGALSSLMSAVYTHANEAPLEYIKYVISTTYTGCVYLCWVITCYQLQSNMFQWYFIFSRDEKSV